MCPRQEFIFLYRKKMLDKQCIIHYICIAHYSEAHTMTEKERTEQDIGTLETEMNRGFLHVLVLALLEKDMYGYAMVKHMEAMGYKVEENTLYPLLRRLEKNGWIASKWDLSEDRPRKFYGITAPGRSLRSALLDVWKTQNRVLDQITKEIRHV